MNTTRIFLLLVMVVCLLHGALADDRTSLRVLGMGRSAAAVSRGTDAIGVNPANIAIPDIGNFNLSLINSSFRISTELMTYDIYQQYFTGIDTGGSKRAPYPLTQQDKDKIRSQLPENGATRINVESMLAGISLETAATGGVGFAVIEHAGVHFSFSRDFFDMLYLQGLPSNAKYVFDGTSFEAWWYREYNISYGRRLPIKIRTVKNLYVGAAVKLIRGYGIFQTLKNNSSIENKTALSDTGKNSLIGNFDFLARRTGVDFFSNDNSDRSFMLFPDPVGKGTGFDFGLSAEYFNGVLLGLSITDIGKISWNKNIIQTAGGGPITFSGYSAKIKDSVKNVVRGKNSAGESFETTLPTVMRVGATVEAQKISFLRLLPGRLLLAAEYAQGFNESLGNTTKPRISLGAEYRVIPFLPLRTGFMFGGGDNVRWTFGFGMDFRFLTLDLASDNFGMFFTPKSFNAASFGVGLKIRV